MRPKPVAGKRNKKFGLTWWGKKWINAVESMGDSNRMSRGRAYARAERVFNIKLDFGRITAKVEGSHGNYNVKADFKKLKDKQWEYLIGKIRGSHALGMVLNNQLPEDIEDICGFDFIPSDVIADCSCPDYENPCKHIAALYYVMADEIDRAPLILFKLFGMDKNDLFSALTGDLHAIENKEHRTVRSINKNPVKKQREDKSRKHRVAGKRRSRKK